MTIAAGFVFDGGILLCADTKVTAAQKTNETKLFQEIYGENNECGTLFAVAAQDLNFAIAAVRDCEEAVSKIDFSKATSIPTVRKAIESALAKFYRVHIFENPDRKDIGFWLLVGIWLNGETRLYSSQETVLKTVEKYECVGSGGYLAKYLIRQFLGGRCEPLSMEDAGLIAQYSARAAMEYDEICGGEELQTFVLKADGKTEGWVNSMSYPGDEFAKRTQASMWNMLRHLGALKGSHIAEESRMVVDGFCDSVRDINEASIKTHKRWFEIRAAEAEGRL